MSVLSKALKGAKKKTGDLTKLNGNDVSNALKAAKPYAATLAGLAVGGPVGAVLAYRATKTKESQKTLKPILKPLRDTDKNIIRPVVDSGKGTPAEARPQMDAQEAIDKILGGGGSGGGSGGGGSGGGGSGGPTSSGGRQISLVDNPTFDPRFKNAQTGLLTQLQDRAAGSGGPSLAEMQQKQAGNKAMQNTLGAVRAGMGSNAALSARTAALAGGNQMANLANESAMMRMREQQDAQSQIAGLAAQGRQGGATEAGMSMDAQRLNQSSDLSQQNMANEQARADLAAKTQLGSEVIRANAQPGTPAKPGWFETVLPTVVAAGVTAATANPAAGAAAGAGTKAIAQSQTNLVGAPEAPAPAPAPAAAAAPAPIRMPPRVAPVGKQYTVKPQAPAPLPPQTPIMAAAARTPSARSVGRRAF